MEESSHYAFRVIKNVLKIDFLKSVDQEATDYTIGLVDSLGRTLSVGDSDDLSEIVLHLEEKSWVSLELLYDLAAQIKKHSPKNKIDWVETFKYVEIIRLGRKFVDENFKPDPNAGPPGFIVPGYIHISEVGREARMLIDYIQNIDESTVNQVESKVINELKRRSVI